MTRRISCILVALFASFASSVYSADAQNYPNRRINLVIGASPGSATDGVCRLMGKQLESRVKQTIVGENKFGAGGYIAADAVLRAAPDGYTLLCTAELALYSDLFEKDQRSITKGLPLIAAFGSTPLVLLAPTSLKIRSLGDLFSLVRSSPNRFNAAFPVNSTYMLETLSLLRSNGLNMAEISYSSTPQCIQALAAGDAHLLMTSLLSAKPLLDGGRAVALATTGSQRFSLLPDVPTAKEQGVDVNSITWYGLFGAAMLPRDITARLYREVSESMNSPEVVSALAKLGTETLAAKPEELNAMVAQNAKRYLELLNQIKSSK